MLGDADLCCSAGGMKAWKEMQQRQMEFYQGFDQEPPSQSKSSGEDFEAEYSQDVKSHLEEGERCEEAEGKPDEDDEPVSSYPALWSDCRGLLVSRNSLWHTCCGV